MSLVLLGILLLLRFFVGRIYFGFVFFFFFFLLQRRNKGMDALSVTPAARLGEGKNPFFLILEKGML